MTQETLHERRLGIIANISYILVALFFTLVSVFFFGHFRGQVSKESWTRSWMGKGERERHFLA